jgi:hypothetical protein
MLSKHVLLSSATSLVLGSVALAQFACPTIPLCCEYVYDDYSPNVTSVMSQVGIAPTSADVVFPVGIDCVPIEDPPAEYILLWYACFTKRMWPRILTVLAALALENKSAASIIIGVSDTVMCLRLRFTIIQGGKIAFGCALDPPIATA